MLKVIPFDLVVPEQYSYGKQITSVQLYS